MRLILFFSFFLLLNLQLDAQTPLDAPLPDALQSLPKAIEVNHFPATVYASTDEERPDFSYFWKHNTSVLSSKSDLQIIECGAYIFYNNQWNLRVKYDSKQFEDLFNCPKGNMKQGQPYTFVDNWRTDKRLMGGWAMWYFIGNTASGEKVMGYGKLETAGEMIGGISEELTLMKKRSTIQWTGRAAIGEYALSGTIQSKGGKLHLENNRISSGTVMIDTRTLKAEIPQLEQHLKGPDFFDVTKYPDAGFEITSVSYQDDLQCSLNGTLTIKGVSQAMNFPATLSQTADGLQISGKVRIDRTKFGITYNSPNFFENLEEEAISDWFDLEFQLYFQK